MKNKISCLNQLFRLTGCKSGLLTFLVDNKLISDASMKMILMEDHNYHAPQICTLLDQLQKDEKIQMVSYEWTLLPEEKIVLTVVGLKDKYEVSYGV